MKDDVNAVAMASESNKAEGDDGWRMTEKANEKIGQNLDCKDASSWIRDDCLEFYRNELLLLSSDPSSNSQRPKRPPTQVKDRVGLLRLGVNRAMLVKKRFPDALFLEFGVHEGKDLVRMAAFLRYIEGPKTPKSRSKGNTVTSKITDTSKPPVYTTFHGFDSFEGLPEDWINGQFGADDKPYHKRGAFDTGGSKPDVDNLLNNCVKLGVHGKFTVTGSYDDSEQQSPAAASSATTKRLDNIEFHKGWFHESLPGFLDEHANIPIAFIHADADLYTSTITFLRLICERRLLRKGSVILFDEFWNYPGWEEGEYKAFLEIVDEFGLEFNYEYFGYHGLNSNAKRLKHYGYQSVGVVITSDMK